MVSTEVARSRLCNYGNIQDAEHVGMSEGLEGHTTVGEPVLKPAHLMHYLQELLWSHKAIDVLFKARIGAGTQL